MTKQEANQKFNVEFQDRIKATKFPDDLLPKNFDQWKHACLQFESPVTVRSAGLSWHEYKVILMKNIGYSLFEMAILVNIIENKSPNQISPYICDDYYDVQNEIETLSKKWQKIVEPIRLSVQKKIEIMSAPAGAMHSKPLKLITGEA